MIGNISPGSGSCENTLNTLRYADRVKELKKPGSNNELGREDQLAKELMLPRTQKNKQIIIKNESDDEEEIVINPLDKIKSQKKIENRPATGVEKKKPKYIPQSKVEEEEGAFVKKKNVPQPNKNTRKGIINNAHNENNYIRSVNHFGENNQKINRNKSVFGRDVKQLDMVKSIKNNYQLPKKNIVQPLSTDRKSFIQNNSVNFGEKKQAMKMKTDQSDDKLL